MSIRSLVERIVLIAVAAIVWRCWCLQGVLVPNRIDSGSMAPTLLGTHRQVPCADCRYLFPCESAGGDAAPHAICPNCGYANTIPGHSPNLLGDGILVDRSAYSMRQPQRWETIAFRHPEQADRICVKRVVGLPGEEIEIRHGDVYVDGQIQRKTLQRQRSMLIPVYDANHSPTLQPAPAARWASPDALSRWGSHNGRFARAAAADQDAFDWLVYRHWRRVPGRPGAFEPAAIDDTCVYNRTHPRRVEEVSPVDDLFLSFTLVQAWGNGALAVCMTAAGSQLEFRLLPAVGRYEVYRDGRLLPDGKGRIASRIDHVELEFSTIDRQFLVAADGTALGVWPLEDVAENETTTEPLRIGAKGLGVVLEQLRVYRDVYYTRPSGIHARWGFNGPVRLGASEFYVLGDNSPISEDSRSWSHGPGVAASLLVGRPLLVHLPMRQVHLGHWRLQIPDPTRMRYLP